LYPSSGGVDRLVAIGTDYDDDDDDGSKPEESSPTTTITTTQSNPYGGIDRECEWFRTDRQEVRNSVRSKVVSQTNTPTIDKATNQPNQYQHQQDESKHNVHDAPSVLGSGVQETARCFIQHPSN